MRSRALVFAVAAALVALSTGGCTSVLSVIKPSPTIKHVKVAAKVAKPGAPVQGTLKDGAPADLPLWEGASVQKSRIVKSDAGDSWTATLLTPDPFADVAAGMATGFQSVGWQVESQDLSSAAASTTVLTVTGRNAVGVVTVTAKPNKSTQIDYVITNSR